MKYHVFTPGWGDLSRSTVPSCISGSYTGWVSWICTWLLVLTAIPLLGAPPKVVSVSPATGATGIALNTELVIVFDQDMDLEAAPIPSFPQILVGNTQFAPDGVTLTGSWEEDGRTLRLFAQNDLPADTLIHWTLNPAGMSGFVPPLRSAAGEAVPTITGSFRTVAGGGQVPTLESVEPFDGETEVDPASSLTFVFSEMMNVTISPLNGSGGGVVGNLLISPPTAIYTGTWQADGRTLQLQPIAPIPADTEVTWTLNPSGSALPFRSATGEILPSVSGRFTITSGGPTETNQEDCVGIDIGAGFYSFNKGVWYEQIGAAEPVVRSQFPNFVSVQVGPPDAGPVVTGASLTLPGGSRKVLTGFSSLFSTSLTATDEAALDASFPSGNYTLRFGQLNQPERVVPMTLPPIPSTVPRIANLAAAQSIDSAQNFTLSWNAFNAAGSGNYIVVVLSDSNGETAFMAPNPCIPRPLASTATSVVIPADTLKPGVTYDGLIQFGKNFYSASNAIPNMFGDGRVMRSTYFKVQTKSGTNVPPAAARFVDYQLPTDGRPRLTLTGTAGRTYTIQRTTTVAAPQWVDAGTVVISSEGRAVFQDTLTFTTGLRFYRAVSQ
jgi:hypothetical protein